MLESIKKVCFDPKFKAIGIFIALMNVLFTLLVFLKGGNVDGYLSIVLIHTIISILILALVIGFDANLIISIAMILLIELGFFLRTIAMGNIDRYSQGFAIKDAVIICVALIAAIIFIIAYRLLLPKIQFKHMIIFFYIISIITYIVLLIMSKGGSEEGGQLAKAWLSLGSYGLQLTELLKIVVVFFLAMVFSNQGLNDLQKLAYSIPFMGVHGVGSLLIREMGSLLVMVLVYASFCFLFLKSAKLIGGIVGVIVFFAIILVIVGSLIYNHGQNVGYENLNGLFKMIYPPIQTIVQRINIWLNPLGYGDLSYQGKQSLIALSFGGLFGSNEFIYVPSQQSDYIFVLLILNLGLVFGIIVLALFAVIFIYGILSALKVKGDFERCIILGSVFYIVYQSLYMIFGSCGFIIMTGIPISYLSYGGTTSVVTMIFSFLILYLGCKKYPSITWKTLKTNEGKDEFIVVDEESDDDNDSNSSDEDQDYIEVDLWK